MLTPPLAVPPSSIAVTVTVAVPFASAADVNVSVPSAATAGRPRPRTSWRLCPSSGTSLSGYRLLAALG